MLLDPGRGNGGTGRKWTVAGQFLDDAIMAVATDRPGGTPAWVLTQAGIGRLELSNGSTEWTGFFPLAGPRFAPGSTGRLSISGADVMATIVEPAGGAHCYLLRSTDGSSAVNSLSTCGNTRRTISLAPSPLPDLQVIDDPQSAPIWTVSGRQAPLRPWESSGLFPFDMVTSMTLDGRDLIVATPSGVQAMTLGADGSAGPGSAPTGWPASCGGAAPTGSRADPGNRRWVVRLGNACAAVRRASPLARSSGNAGQLSQYEESRFAIGSRLDTAMPLT